jgi:ABC-type multidrug transport system ATPase subunit
MKISAGESIATSISTSVWISLGCRHSKQMSQSDHLWSLSSSHSGREQRSAACFEGTTLMSDAVITTFRVTRRFGGVRAVEGLSLSVPRKSVYAFLGPNGAGKTTTIRMLLGLTRPDSGEVRIFSELMNRANRLALLRRIGSMVEGPSLYPHLTAYENLQVTQRLISLGPSEIDRVLQITWLEKDAHRLVKTYSQGMRQRLGLALALLAKPDLLILDEPTNGLDPAGMIEMRELIRRLPDEYGVTVFLSSHLLGEVEQIATHLGIIGRGQLLFEGTLEAFQQRSGNRVAIETDSPAAAVEILHQGGWHPLCLADSVLRVEFPDRESVASAVAMLVSKGAKIYQIRTEQPSLENLFLDLTKQSRFGSHTQEELPYE